MNLDARLPPSLAARFVGVTKQAFNYWRASGKISPDENGLYRLGDVLEAERATRRSPNSRRGVTLRRPATGPNSWAERDRKQPTASRPQQNQDTTLTPTY